jgi:hypothetical protein
MRLLSSLLALVLTLCACGGISAPVRMVPSAHAPARVVAQAGGNPWIFVTTRNPDPHIGNTTVLAYAPAAQYGQPVKITKGLTDAAQLRTDSLGNLFVLNYATPSSSSAGPPPVILLFASPYTGSPKTLPVKGVQSFVLDASNNLFALRGNDLVELKPPYQTVFARFSLPGVVYGGTNNLTIDSKDDVFVAVRGGVNEYSPPSYALRATASLPSRCEIFVEGVNSSNRLFVATYCAKSGSHLTDYRIVGRSLKQAHAPVRICDPGPAAVSPAGNVFVSTACGLKQISPLFVTIKPLGAFGKTSGVPAISSGGQLYFGETESPGGALRISPPPYSTVEQTVKPDPNDYINSIALGPG